MANKEKPTGKSISEKAKAAKLRTEDATTHDKGGKKIKLTPADLGHLKSPEELEEGQFIGLLETEVAGDKSGLPPGTYNMFLAKEGGDWHVYAESGGTIVAEAASVVERKDTPKNMKPQYRDGSFCWWVWLLFTGFTWCF